MKVILSGGGSIYKNRNTVAPAFTLLSDVDRWRGLYGMKFTEISIEVDEGEESDRANRED